ncbi:uncharacterized protein BCR38DRAFT_479624 [Pseudomassariella vexata]|uniref:Uncharacterized protein n=1 Tax=Pseudomassariella vexata TaxID=1141098 RepID=A0A1Y2EHP6_9PEZI|nr:uncharacterized protein BCR38DRAFT_479624 [Pseudomassariella vexata]ORY71102.1 hypothetical protein BCR38DRAFT_479624 [Pseudomassariella vexata]
MHDNRTHPLLAQIPLTVSPFVTLPVAATLPYTYKTMPSTLPPSSTGVLPSTSSTNTSTGDESQAQNKPQYVISQSGHAAHPDDIIRSCEALRSYVSKMQEDAERDLRELDERIRARELAEKRRVAPGWLDSEARLLEPERKGGDNGGERAGGGAGGARELGDDAGVAGGVAGPFAEMSLAEREGASEMAVDQGEEIDRVLGGLR